MLTSFVVLKAPIVLFTSSIIGNLFITTLLLFFNDSIEYFSAFFGFFKRLSNLDFGNDSVIPFPIKKFGRLGYFLLLIR